MKIEDYYWDDHNSDCETELYQNIPYDRNKKNLKTKDIRKVLVKGLDRKVLTKLITQHNKNLDTVYSILTNQNPPSNEPIKDLYLNDWDNNDTDFIYCEDIDLVQIRQHNIQKYEEKITYAEYGKADLIELRDWLNEIIKRMDD